MEFHFLELKKFTKELDEVKSIIDQWAYFLKHADEVDEIPYPLSDNKEIVRAFEVLEQAKFTRPELDIYFALVDQYRTEVGRREAALEEGEYKKSLEIAQNCLKRGMNIEEIGVITGLPVETIKKLKILA